MPPIPANLAASCPDLKPLTGTDGRAVLRWASATVRLYQDCQDKVERLRQAWPGGMILFGPAGTAPSRAPAPERIPP